MVNFMLCVFQHNRQLLEKLKKMERRNEARIQIQVTRWQCLFLTLGYASPTGNRIHGPREAGCHPLLSEHALREVIPQPKQFIDACLLCTFRAPFSSPPLSRDVPVNPNLYVHLSSQDQSPSSQPAGPPSISKTQAMHPLTY